MSELIDFPTFKFQFRLISDLWNYSYWQWIKLSTSGAREQDINLSTNLGRDIQMRITLSSPNYVTITIPINKKKEDDIIIFFTNHTIEREKEKAPKIIFKYANPTKKNESIELHVNSFKSSTIDSYLRYIDNENKFKILNITYNYITVIFDKGGEFKELKQAQKDFSKGLNILLDTIKKISISVSDSNEENEIINKLIKQMEPEPRRGLIRSRTDSSSSSSVKKPSILGKRINDVDNLLSAFGNISLVPASTSSSSSVPPPRTPASTSSSSSVPAPISSSSSSSSSVPPPRIPAPTSSSSSVPVTIPSQESDLLSAFGNMTVDDLEEGEIKESPEVRESKMKELEERGTEERDTEVRESKKSRFKLKYLKYKQKYLLLKKQMELLN
jgi:hypothetical protein